MMLISLKVSQYFHTAVKAKAGAGVVAEKIHHLRLRRAVLHHQMHRHVKMAQGDQRLDTVLLHSSNSER